MTIRKLYLGPLTDNRRWDMVDIRPDDVLVVTPPKCGTTWMQTIVALLLSGDPDVEPELAMKMPWVDIRLREMAEVAGRLEAMENRRSMKSHTPMDGVPFDDQAHYICVFRHPLDAHISCRNHMRITSMSWFAHWFPKEDPDGVTFRRFLDGGPEGFDSDAMPLAHILRHYQAAKVVADRPNVSLIHYADMCCDLAGTFAKIADLLGTPYSAAVMEQLVQTATFDNMKAQAERFSPWASKGGSTPDAEFFHSGTSGKWRGVLTDDEVAAYDAMMDAHLSPEDRAWLEYGSSATTID